MNKITFSTLLLGIITFCIISCAPEEKKHSLTAGEVPLGVSCDSLEREFATKWTNLAEYDQGQAHYYQTSTVFLDRFQDKLANCFATIPKENITKILGEPTLVMTNTTPPADTILYPDYCYKGFTKDTRMEFTICAFFDRKSHEFVQFSFLRNDRQPPKAK